MTLDISKNKIKDEGIKAMGETLNINKSLKVLKASDNDITSEGLINNNTPINLNLNYKDAIVICDLLKINKELEVLTLGYDLCVPVKELKVIPEITMKSRIEFVLGL